MRFDKTKRWLSAPVSLFQRWQQKLPLAREGKFWLLFALFLLGTGLFRSINLINLLACFLIVTLLYNMWLSRRQLRNLRGRRIVEEAFFAQTPCPITLELHNVGRRPASGIRLIQQDAENFVASLPGKKAIQIDVSLTFPRRGRQTLGALEVRSGFPVGLADFHRALEPAEEVVVLPRLGILRRGALKRHLQEHSPTIGQARTVPRRHPAAQTDFHGLRVFQPGDSPRWIHWRTSARRGELMVKEFEETPSDNLILIVDLWKPAPVPEEFVKLPKVEKTFDSDTPDPNLELLIGLAATICWEWCRLKGDRLILAIAGAEPIVVAGITSRQLALDMLRHLAVQEGGPRSNVDQLLDNLGAVELPTAPILLLSTHGCEFIDDLQMDLHRTIALVDVSQQEHEGFFEWPINIQANLP